MCRTRMSFVLILLGQVNNIIVLKISTHKLYILVKRV